jgi:hypothetical protein
MTAAEIRRCVTMTNEQKPDLIVMTGDYLSWDTAGQGEVVQALAGLRAPYGVFGSLGTVVVSGPINNSSCPPPFAGRAWMVEPAAILDPVNSEKTMRCPSGDHDG